MPECHFLQRSLLQSYGLKSWLKSNRLKCYFVESIGSSPLIILLNFDLEQNLVFHLPVYFFFRFSNNFITIFDLPSFSAVSGCSVPLYPPVCVKFSSSTANKTNCQVKLQHIIIHRCYFTFKRDFAAFLWESTGNIITCFLHSRLWLHDNGAITPPLFTYSFIDEVLKCNLLLHWTTEEGEIVFLNEIFFSGIMSYRNSRGEVKSPPCSF